MAKIKNEKKKRKGNYLENVKRFYIFSEGTCTEPNYFKSFRERINKSAIYKDSVIVKPIGLGLNTTQVVNEARKFIDREKIKNADVWCVIDKDDFPDDHFDRVEQICEQYTKNGENNFYCAWSNQSFEYWYILHFDYYASDNDRKKYIEFLDKQFKKYGLSGYSKEYEKNWEVLEQYGDPKKAIKRAKSRLNECRGLNPSKCRPATKVCMLVEELAKYLPTQDREKYLG